METNRDLDGRSLDCSGLGGNFVVREGVPKSKDRVSFSYSYKVKCFNNGPHTERKRVTGTRRTTRYTEPLRWVGRTLLRSL